MNATWALAAGNLLAAKKTGFPSQGMTEKPGEYSGSVQRGLTGTTRLWLYNTKVEITWALKEQTAYALPEIGRQPSTGVK